MNSSDIQIRKTTQADFNDIMDVHKQGFGYDKEAHLVAGLLADKTAEPMISLLAFYKGEAVGHILFTRAYLDGQQEQPLIHILAPLAVKPEFQKKGIGGMLIRRGVELLQEMGSKLVFVLGHKEYYPKYGFEPHATRMGYPAPYPVPDELGEYWMVQSISPDGWEIGKGKINCADFLNEPEHWRDDETEK